MAYRRFRGYRRRYRPRRSYRRSYTSASSSRRRAPARRTSRRTTSRKSSCKCGPSEVTAGDKFLLAQMDPFEPNVQGAKIPDANSVPSVGFPMTELLTLQTSTAGDARCWAFMPTASSGIVPSVGGASSWAWPSTHSGAVNWTKRPDLINTFEMTRPVAHGIRISCPNAPTSTTGFVHIAVAYESFNRTSTWPWPTDVTGFSGYQQYKRVTLASLTQSPLTIINKYIDETAFRYTSPDQFDGPPGTETNQNLRLQFNTPYSWGAVLIAVEGAASTSPLQVEQILHVEGIPKSTSFMMGGIAASYNPGLLHATSNMVARNDIAHTEEQQDSYISQAFSNAYSGASSVISTVASEASSMLPSMDTVVRGATRALVNYGMRSMGGRLRAPGLPGINDRPNRLALTR